MKTINKITVIGTEVIVEYTNTSNVPCTSTIATEAIENYLPFNANVQLIIDGINDEVEMPIIVKYSNDILTVSRGKKEPVLMEYVDLSDQDKLVIDSMKAKAYDVLREELVSLFAVLRSGKVTLNNIEYDYALFQSPEFVSAIQLALRLLNS